MTRLGTVLAGAVVAACLLPVAVQDLAEAARHFKAHPDDLLYVLGIALVGGFGALVFGQQAAGRQHTLKRLAWGTLATASTGFFGYTVLMLISHRSAIGEMGNYLAWGTPLPVAGLAAYLWWEFLRSRKGPGRDA